MGPHDEGEEVAQLVLVSQHGSSPCGERRCERAEASM